MVESRRTKSVISGLTSLQKSNPTLDLTNNQISIIGDLVQSLADLAESGYRNSKLGEIIRGSTLLCSNCSRRRQAFLQRHHAVDWPASITSSVGDNYSFRS